MGCRLEFNGINLDNMFNFKSNFCSCASQHGFRQAEISDLANVTQDYGPLSHASGRKPLADTGCLTDEIGSWMKYSWALKKDQILPILQAGLDNLGPSSQSVVTGQSGSEGAVFHYHTLHAQLKMNFTLRRFIPKGKANTFYHEGSPGSHKIFLSPSGPSLYVPSDSRSNRYLLVTQVFSMATAPLSSSGGSRTISG